MADKTIIGKCPKCGNDIISGKFGPFCKEKCGFKILKFRGVQLSEKQISSLLNKETILLENLKSKAGKEYSLYVTPTGEIEEYEYDYNGYSGKGFRMIFETKFPPREGFVPNEIDEAVSGLDT